MSSGLRFLIVGLVALLGYRLFFADRAGGGLEQPVQIEPQATPPVRAPYQYCEIATDSFSTTLSSRGGVVRSVKVLTPKYRKAGEAPDLSTTPHPGVAVGSPLAEDPSAPGPHEFRQQLFSTWRNPTRPEEPATGAPWNVAFDSVDFALRPAPAGTCEFVYEDAAVRVVKRVAATGRPYELEVNHEITNLSGERRAHALALDTVAWRLTSEVEGKMFRVSPYVTHVECVPTSGGAQRLLTTDFEPKDFEDSERFEVKRPWGFYQSRADASVAAVSNAYFTQALAPTAAPVAPRCQVLIEQRFAGGRSSDPASGAFYRARLAYPAVELAPGEQARYAALSYVGPKERLVLEAAGGDVGRFDELIDLGFFSQIAKVLVGFLLKVHGWVPNWGLAIVVLTLTARVLLFPLSWPGIRNMIRMRELKPELDALNERFPADPQARGLAQMELYRKHQVNPLKGCLPQLASMPVWLALYTTLQTAVELYNIPFLWFPDLSQSDPYFILPLVIGGTYFLQQKLMPMQGGDPAQQKMMMYMMPGMFTVFMLFLPAGLGVYMFTNSVLAIAQQQVVEWRVRKNVKTPPGARRSAAPPAKEGRKAGA